MQTSASPISPTPERVFGWHDHAALWFSLGVGLLVIQVGAYLVPALGTRDALAAVVVGSILGPACWPWLPARAAATDWPVPGRFTPSTASPSPRRPLCLTTAS